MEECFFCLEVCNGKKKNETKKKGKKAKMKKRRIVKIDGGGSGI